MLRRLWISTAVFHSFDFCLGISGDEFLFWGPHLTVLRNHFCLYAQKQMECWESNSGQLPAALSLAPSHRGIFIFDVAISDQMSLMWLYVIMYQN